MHPIDPYASPGYGGDAVLGEDDELVRRLRALKWTEVDPQLRFRCWEEFSRKLEEGGLPAGSRPARAGDGGDLYAFTRGSGPRRTTGELQLPGLLRRVAQGPGGRLDLARPPARRGGLAARVA